MWCCFILKLFKTIYQLTSEMICLSVVYLVNFTFKVLTTDEKEDALEVFHFLAKFEVQCLIMELISNFFEHIFHLVWYILIVYIFTSSDKSDRN